MQSFALPSLLHQRVHMSVAVVAASVAVDVSLTTAVNSLRAKMAMRLNVCNAY